MLQNPCKTLGFKKNMVYKIPPGGGKPYPASGLYTGQNYYTLHSNNRSLVFRTYHCIPALKHEYTGHTIYVLYSSDGTLICMTYYLRLEFKPWNSKPIYALQQIATAVVVPRGVGKTSPCTLI